MFKAIEVNATSRRRTGREWALDADTRHGAVDALLRQLGKTEEMAQAVFFLIAYGDYITGQVIGVNGGMYM